MFNDPNLFAKIAGNPSTEYLLKDPNFTEKLHSIQKNPKLLQQEIMHDERLMIVLEILLGIIDDPVHPNPFILY